MEALLSPTFVDISAAGAIETRNQHLADMYQHLNGDILSMEQRVVNVRVLGDIALVEGTYIMHHKQNGHTFDERGVFTHVYQRIRANWLCITSQRTAVVDRSDEKTKPAGKRSNAELPFHIPLVYKGSDSAKPQPAPTSQTPRSSRCTPGPYGQRSPSAASRATTGTCVPLRRRRSCSPWLRLTRMGMAS